MSELLISTKHVALNRALHESPRGFGASGRKHAATVQDFALALNAQSILDYGCGAGTLKTAMELMDGWHGEFQEYDPAVAGKEALPWRADLVVCTDVLEHVEPDKLDAVLAHLRALARKALFLCIATQPAHKVLPDGRNAHLIVEPPQWWRKKLDVLGLTEQRYSERINSEGVADVSFWIVRSAP